MPGRAWRWLAIVAGVCVLLFLAGAAALVPRGCGCGPNPDQLLTGTVTSFDPTARMFTLRVEGQPDELTFLIPAQNSTALAQVQQGFKSGERIQVVYPRKQQSMPFTVDEILLPGVTATPSP
jgi:hypothetical protein